MKKFLFLPLMALLLVFSANAQAARWKIGADNRIDFIADVGLKNEKGRPMALGYMVSTEYFFIPYSVKGKLALTAQGEDNTYYSLPEGDELKECRATASLRGAQRRGNPGNDVRLPRRYAPRNDGKRSFS
ncbi:hypothetical protein AGMMS50289_00760 [Betaproteobacteria bacterium]|nr:hypothetical protein AGMMS50289_00760 [Betaproteobacteria bacterium]